MTKETIVFYIHKFFSTTNENTVSVDEIFRIYGRSGQPDRIRKMWLAGKLTDMYKHKFLKPVYDSNRVPKKLIALELGEAGLEALHRSHSDKDHKEVQQTLNKVLNVQTYIDESSHVSISEVVEKVKKLKHQYPEFEIIFDMKLRSI